MKDEQSKPIWVNAGHVVARATVTSADGALTRTFAFDPPVTITETGWYAVDMVDGKIIRTVQDEQALAEKIGRWIIDTHREQPGVQITTPFLIDGKTVNVGIFSYTQLA